MRRQEISTMFLLVFASFAETMMNLSAEAIIKELELESKMLEYDGENYRLYLPAEAYSIFCFRRFVRHARLGKLMSRCMPLPAEHVKFYRETVAKLIQANELPQTALKQFDDEFSAAR